MILNEKKLPFKFEIAWPMEQKEIELFSELNMFLNKFEDMEDLISFLKEQNIKQKPKQNNNFKETNNSTFFKKNIPFKPKEHLWTFPSYWKKIIKENLFLKDNPDFLTKMKKDKKWRYLPNNWIELFELIYFANISTEQIDTIDIHWKIGSFHSFRYWENQNDRFKKYYLKYQLFLWSIEDWNVSNITDFTWMFHGVQFKNPNQDLSKWDVSKGVSFEEMFEESNFNGNISKWNVSNGIIFESMFSLSDFTGENGNIWNWNTSNWRNFDFMFFDCNLNTNFDISKWDFSKWITFFNMFSEAQYNFKLNYKYFQKANADYRWMFQNCKSNNVIDLSQWNQFWKIEESQYKGIVSGVDKNNVKLNKSFNKEIAFKTDD